MSDISQVDSVPLNDPSVLSSISRSLVKLEDKEPTTTTLIIAEMTGLQHRSVIAYIRQYEEDFKEFGQLAVNQKVVLRPQGGGSIGEYYSLNESQSSYLLTLMSNSPIVRRFKVALIKAFYNMREQLRLQEQQLSANKVAQLQSLSYSPSFLSSIEADRKAGVNELIIAQKVIAHVNSSYSISPSLLGEAYISSLLNLTYPYDYMYRSPNGNAKYLSLISRTIVNNLLVSEGYQTRHRHPNNTPFYSPTAKGVPFSITHNFRSHHGLSLANLYWLSSFIRSLIFGHKLVEYGGKASLQPLSTSDKSNPLYLQYGYLEQSTSSTNYLLRNIAL